MAGTLTMATRTLRDMQRWAGKGSTSARGYGREHQSKRERRIRRYRPGDLCAHCHQPIWYPPAIVAQYVDLPHNADRTGYLPGLAHRTCNRRDGQRITTAILNARRGRTTTWRTSRQW